MGNMQGLTKEKLMKHLDKTIQRAVTLEKKKKRWGITEQENKELSKLMLNYTRYYFKLMDDIFIDYIEPFLFTDEIIDLKQEILFKSGWEGNLLFEDIEICEFVSTVDSIEEVRELIQLLKTEELKMTLQFEQSEYGLEVTDLFRALNHVDKEDSIAKYVQLRYDMMISLLEGDKIE